MIVLNEQIPYFSDDGLSCAESTLRYLIEHKHVDLPLDAVKMMTAMHGNMGRCATCGAINGSVAAIGSKFGRTQPNQDSKIAQRAVEEFITAFEERFGSTKCETLLNGNDMADLTQQAKCSTFVMGALEIIIPILEKYEKEQAN